MRVLREPTNGPQFLRSGVRAIQITTKPTVKSSSIFDVSGVRST